MKTNLIIVFPTSITYLVQACQPSLACCDLRSLTQIQIPSPYQLPSAYPAHGCQEGCPLTIIAPGQNGLLLHCQDRSLFRSLGSSDDTDGPIRVWATLSRNFVSHIRKSHRTGMSFDFTVSQLPQFPPKLTGRWRASGLQFRSSGPIADVMGQALCIARPKLSDEI